MYQCLESYALSPRRVCQCLSHCVNNGQDVVQANSKLRACQPEFCVLLPQPSSICHELSVADRVETTCEGTTSSAMGNTVSCASTVKLTKGVWMHLHKGERDSVHLDRNLSPITISLEI